MGATQVLENARVTSVHKDSYYISKGDKEVFAECSGNLLFTSDSPLDLPTTGDWVKADFYDDDSHAIIHEVLPRNTLLKRKTAGKRVDYQLIGANIDVAFIMQSLNENFNLRRLERYLAVVNDAGIEPVVLLSKSDLVTLEEVEKIKAEIAGIAPDVSTMAFSCVTQEHVASLNYALMEGQTYCLIGSSGVGKTTLINTLIGNDQYETKEVSNKESKGRHTTTSRQLILLANGAMIIDTPGMRELGSLAIDTGIDETFSDITALAKQCRFRDCSHANEKGCTVQKAVKSGKLDKQRFNNYRKMIRESEFNEMTYLDKRKKDKQFTKYCKSVMKGNRKRKQ